MTKQSELIVECTTKSQMDEIVQYATRCSEHLGIKWRYIYYNLANGDFSYSDTYYNVKRNREDVPVITFMEWSGLPNTEPISPSYASLIGSIKNKLLEDYHTYVTDRHILEIIDEVIKFNGNI